MRFDRILFPFVLVVTAACSPAPSSDVWTDYDTAAVETMASYQTFAWLPEPNANEVPGRDMSDMDVQRFVRSIESELVDRGYQRAHSGASDFLVGYDAAIQRKMTAGSNTRVGVGFGTGGGAIGVSGGGGGGQTYDEGTLVIDIVDARSETLVWRGIAEGAVRPASNPEDREKQLRAIVRDLLKRFPPKAK